MESCPVYAMKACRGSMCIIPLILNLGPVYYFPYCIASIYILRFTTSGFLCSLAMKITLYE